MNSVILQGRLTKDPEIRYTSGTQMAVATFTLAVNREKKENEADFIRITVFGKQAESAEKHIGKGCRVNVQGRLQTGSYDGKDGKKVYTTDVIASRVEYIDFKNNGQRDEPVEVEPAYPQDDTFQRINDAVPF